MNGMIEIFGSPTCKKCNEAKAYFDEKQVAYTEYNVKEDAVRKQEMVDATQTLGLPQIRINGDWYIGFDAKRLDEILTTLG